MWYGIEDAFFADHGSWADPEIYYQGLPLNYWDVEDELRNQYDAINEDRMGEDALPDFHEWLELADTQEYIRQALDDCAFCFVERYPDWGLTDEELREKYADAIKERREELEGWGWGEIVWRWGWEGERGVLWAMEWGIPVATPNERELARKIWELGE